MYSYLYMQFKENQKCYFFNQCCLHCGGVVCKKKWPFKTELIFVIFFCITFWGLLKIVKKNRQCCRVFYLIYFIFFFSLTILIFNKHVFYFILISII